MKQSVAGKVFVVTGAIGTMRRMQIKAFVNRQGGRVCGAVMPETDYLITAGSDSTAKRKRAEELGIQIISIDQFVTGFLPDGFIQLCPRMDFINDALVRAGFPAYGNAELAFKALAEAAKDTERRLQILIEAMKQLGDIHDGEY